MRVLKGGAPRRQFLQLEWEFKVLPSELESSKEEIGLVMKQLDEERGKNAEMQEELTRLQHEKQKSDRKAQTTMQQMKAMKEGKANVSRGKRLNRSFDEYSESHKRRLKRARTNSCGDSLSWMEQEGYLPVSVEVKNLQTGKVEKVELRRSDAEEILGPSADVTTEELDIVNMMLYVKDRYNVSDGAYQEMAKVCREMPCHYKIKRRIKELNEQWGIRPTAEGIVGVQQPLEERLRVRVRHLLQTSRDDAPFLQDKKLRVKLSGDGTNIGKRLHVVSFTFTLLDEVETTASFEGSHILAIFKEPEKYEKLEIALADIRDDVEQLSSIEVDGVTYDITYYLGADWKFLAIVTGIDSASSEYACIWCKCKSSE